MESTLLRGTAVAMGSRRPPCTPGLIGIFGTLRPDHRRGVSFGQGVADAMGWVDKKGGVDNSKVNVDTVDYSYQVPRAVSQYKKWAGENVAAILGWGTADTEALTGFVAQD